MSSNEEIQKVGSLIPEIYYDVIARIIPGCILMFGLTFLVRSAMGLGWLPELDAFLKMSFSAGGFAIFATLSLGYVFGMLITPWGQPLTSFLRRRWYSARRKELQSPIVTNSDIILQAIQHSMESCSEGVAAIERLKCIPPEAHYELDHLLFESVRKSAANAGVVAKMRAEMGSFRNLTVSLAILMTASCIASIFTPHPWLGGIGPSILFPFSVKAAFYREGAYYTRVLTFYYLAHKESIRKTSDESKQEGVEQAGAGQPATRPVVEPKGGHKPQPEAEGHSR